MRCPSCGAVHGSKMCPTSGTVAATALALSPQEVELESAVEGISANAPNIEAQSEMDQSTENVRPASRLIEFPGVTRRAVPQWRKDLGERVREVQERRARESAAEAAETNCEAEVQPQSSPPQLELLPQSEAPPVNPVVAAALRRIERAYQPPLASGYSTNARAATAMAMAPDHEPTVTPDAAEFFPIDATNNLSATAAVEPDAAILPVNDEPPVIERTHNLVVVQPTVAVEDKPAIEKPRPKRLISEDDPALSYLDSLGVIVDEVSVEDRAPLGKRLVAAVLDIITVGFLALPFAAVIELRNGNWHQPKVLALMGGIVAATMFLYETVSTALTGRTLGMRLTSLRSIDIRTRLIPTGSQSAGRALVYVLSLTTLGLGFLATFVRGEGKSMHDRLSRTAVVRD
jgi:uncharacterized RDD family membrane protein YckC